LKQKKQKFKAAKKKTAFGLNFDLHQCQVRRGDFLIANRNFPVLLSIDFDLNSFFFEAEVENPYQYHFFTIHNFTHHSKYKLLLPLNFILFPCLRQAGFVLACTAGLFL
jgi:hypothetical protein